MKTLNLLITVLLEIIQLTLKDYNDENLQEQLSLLSDNEDN